MELSNTKELFLIEHLLKQSNITRCRNEELKHDLNVSIRTMREKFYKKNALKLLLFKFLFYIFFCYLYLRIILIFFRSLAYLYRILL